MSQDSVSTQELLEEITECTTAHENLLKFSKQDTLILPDNMEQPSTSFQWGEESKIVILEHRVYYRNMLNFLNELEKTGPTAKLPKPPKRKLQYLLNTKLGKKKKQEEMSPMGFHNYLQEHIQDMTRSILRDKFIFKTGEHVPIEQLKDAYKHLCRQNSQSMLFNCEFGNFLNALYNWFEQQKNKGLIAVPWEAWLNTHINISASHARNLRQLVDGFPKLKTIDLPLREVLQNLKLLKEMLTVPECLKFWSSGADIPLTITSPTSKTVRNSP